MAGLADIASAAADQIRTALDGVDSLNVQVEPRLLPAPSEGIAIDIYPPFSEGVRDLAEAAFDEMGAYMLTIRARINTPDFDEAYDILVGLMDDENDLNLALALLDDPTLNGTAQSIDVRDGTGLRAYERIGGEGADIGCQWTLLAIPAKS